VVVKLFGSFESSCLVTANSPDQCVYIPVRTRDTLVGLVETANPADHPVDQEPRSRGMKGLTKYSRPRPNLDDRDKGDPLST
jgi:hypothetical protein